MSEETNDVAVHPLGSIFCGMMCDELFREAICNLNALPTLDEVKGNPMPGKKFHKGVMGFRRLGRNLTLSIGCGRAMVRQIELHKFIAMVQNMKNEQDATTVLENFVEGDDSRMPRGQILGRINPDYSCIVVAQGLVGRVIQGPTDLVRLDCYYLSKEVLTGFYISSKLQDGMQNDLDKLIGSFDGWKAYNLPRDTFEPGL